MNWSSVSLWGFAATVVLTIVLMSTRAFNLTRVDIPFLLGTMFTADRNKAKWMGILVHFIFGQLFAIIYAYTFEQLGQSSWWFGALIALVHAGFVLTVGMSIVSVIHPRMATEDRGPDPTHMLEPPGFLVLNYGHGTPQATLLAHLIYGAILGQFYQLS